MKEARLKIWSFFLFVIGFGLITASFNVWLLGLPETKETSIAWALFDVGIFFIPLSFYLIGKLIKQSAFVYAGIAFTGFALNNLFDFITGTKYVVGVSEYVFAAIVLAYCYYDFKRGS